MSDELTVELRDTAREPLRIAGIHLDLLFYTGGRLRYSFSLGRTDDDGVCRTTFGEVERQLEANQRLFVMDYNTPLDECDPIVGIVAPTAGELSEREGARAKLWPVGPSIYAGTSNERVRCPEQKFKLDRGGANTFELVCEAQPPA